MNRRHQSNPELQRGSVMVEAALVIPMLVLLTIGVMDFGLAYWNLSTAQTSLRNVTRYLSKLPAAQLCDALATDAKQLVVYGKTSPLSGDKPLIAGWNASGIENITIVVKEGSTYNDPDETTGCTSNLTNYRRISISATVPYDSIAWSILRLPETITMNSQHEERWIGQ